MRPSPITGQEAILIENALAKVQHLRGLFPAFYQAHLAQTPLTTVTLTGAVFAFVALVNRDCFELESPVMFDIPFDPIEALTPKPEDYGSGDPLLLLEEVGGWIERPRPLLYGVGIALVLNGDEPLAYDALTLALWQLCRETEWALGIDIADLLDAANLPDDLRDQIVQLPALPGGTRMTVLCETVQLPGHPWSDRAGELIRYAFGRTDNPMANVTNEEVELLYGGSTDDSWEDVPEITKTARDAVALVQLYGQWATAVEKAPTRALRELTRALQVASKRKALIDLLVDTGRLDAADVAIEVPA